MSGKKHPMALRAGDMANFETLLKAAKNGDLALVSAIREADKAKVALVCAMRKEEGDNVLVIPLAVMTEGNPYDLFEDPTQE